MSGKMAYKNKKQMKQTKPKSSRFKRGGSIVFSDRRKSRKMEEEDVEFIDLNPIITEDVETCARFYQELVVPSPPPSSVCSVTPDSDDGGVDLANHPARGNFRDAQNELRNTPMTPLEELSWGCTPTPPFTTPTPPLSADRSRPVSACRIDCYLPEKGDIDLSNYKPPVLHYPPDYEFRVSPTRRSPRLNISKRSASPDSLCRSPSKSPRISIKEEDEPAETFKVPAIPARPTSLPTPSTSGATGGKGDPSPDPSNDSSSTPTSSYSSGSPLYHSSSSDSSSVFNSGGGSGGSADSSLSGSVSIPSYNSNPAQSPVQKPDDFDVLVDPFKVCTIKNLIRDGDYLEKLRRFLTTELQWERRSADMFDYYQGNDEQFSNNHLIKCLEYTFVDKLMPFMAKVFNIPLNINKLSISASKYTFTNYLCCHDDVYDDRRIAFVLYLNRRWKKEYGGTLDFYRSNGNHYPTQTYSSIIPDYNRFVFFEVGSVTYHQVAEVIAPGQDRITINGWFHGVFPPNLLPKIPEPKIAEIRFKNVDIQNLEVLDWIHPMYLEANRQMQIQANFKNDTFITLPGFLTQDKFIQVTLALRKATGWVLIGPPNRRNYEVLPQGSLPKTVLNCLKVFVSEVMFLLMFNLTGCKLHALSRLANELEVEIELAKHHIDAPLDDEEMEQCDEYEKIDIETAKQLGVPIAGNILYGTFDNPTPLSPRQSTTPERQTSLQRPSTSKEKTPPKKIAPHCDEPSTSKATTPPKMTASPKRKVTFEKPPTPEKPEHLKNLASPKKTVTQKKAPSPKKQSPSPKKESPSPKKQSPSPKKESPHKPTTAQLIRKLTIPDKIPAPVSEVSPKKTSKLKKPSKSKKTAHPKKRAEKKILLPKPSISAKSEEFSSQSSTSGESSSQSSASRDSSPQPSTSREFSPQPSTSRESSPQPSTSRESSPQPSTSKKKTVKPTLSKRSLKPKTLKEISPKSILKKKRKKIEVNLVKKDIFAPEPPVRPDRPTTWLKNTKRDPRATIIIRRWVAGHYSLLNDDEEVLKSQGVLDCHIAFDNCGNCEAHGGYISYVNKETGEEFYRTNPQNNCLSVVWLPPTEYRFVKYHNCLCKKTYYDINVIFKE